MAYMHFNPVKSNPASATLPQLNDRLYTDMMAVRDAVVTGIMPGWNYSIGGGAPHQPTQILWTRGTETIAINCTWGTTGGAADNLVGAVVHYRPNASTAYESLGTLAIDYTPAGDVTTATWS